jgi:hypothetical protein
MLKQNRFTGPELFVFILSLIPLIPRRIYYQFLTVTEPPNLLMDIWLWGYQLLFITVPFCLFLFGRSLLRRQFLKAIVFLFPAYPVLNVVSWVSRVDSFSSAVYLLCFLLIVATLPLSFGPLVSRSRFTYWRLYLPLPYLIAYSVYESQVPVEMNIRVDLVIIYPVLTVITIIGLVRWAATIIYNFSSHRWHLMMANQTLHPAQPRWIASERVSSSVKL